MPKFSKPKTINQNHPFRYAAMKIVMENKIVLAPNLS